MEHLKERTDFLNTDERSVNDETTALLNLEKGIINSMGNNGGISKYHWFKMLALMINTFEIDFSEFSKYYYSNGSNS